MTPVQSGRSQRTAKSPAGGEAEPCAAAHTVRAGGLRLSSPLFSWGIHARESEHLVSLE